MRCRAYQLPKESYEELESQILQSLGDGDQDQLGHLVGEHDLEIELLSGEWRLLFGAREEYNYQVVDVGQRIARMAVSPSELPEFVSFLRDPERQREWWPISFGLAELTDALPVDVDLVGVVFIEESDDWLWAPPVNELVAIRPEVYALIEPHLRELVQSGDFSQVARLAEDHSEGCVEFSNEQWKVLMRHSAERVPELLSVYDARLSAPEDYTSILEALAQVADPRFQPSLDAWIRVHASAAQYALYFRDAHVERREFDGSGLIRLGMGVKGPGQTQPLPMPVPRPPLPGPPTSLQPEGIPADADPGDTLPGTGGTKKGS